MHLSTHFELSEFVFSQTAARHGIDNAPPPEAIERLRQVMAQHPELALLQTLGALRIARAYDRLQLAHAQQAELEWVTASEPEKSALRTTALERLLLLDIKEGDQLEFFEVKEVARTL
jgi:hypothetical protein